MDQIYKYPPKLKPKDYDIMITSLLENKEMVEAPAGASKQEQLSQHLENYCTMRTAEGSTNEDMESGNVWNKDGCHHFIFS